MDKEQFTELFRKRTQELAVRIIKMYTKLPKTDELRIVGKQLIRSYTPVAANYRAACRARSKAEFFATDVKEADETLLRLEIMEKAGIISSNKVIELKSETLELLSVFSKSRHNTK
jgi:four helix bundle protein